MSNFYKVMLPLLVNGEHKQGDVFEHEFDSWQDEDANLRSGLLTIVPRKYKVIGDSIVHGTPPGSIFEAALPMGQEDLLVQGNQIEREDSTPEAPAKGKDDTSAAKDEEPKAATQDEKESK